jgi:hypothetical protein
MSNTFKLPAMQNASGMPIPRIAPESETAANFGRARRWFGMSAGAYRRRLLERR